MLLPVIDDDKHYWVGEDDLEKLLARGERWLPRHPEREEIVRRYLRRRGPLVREALARLVADEDPEPTTSEAARAREEDVLEEKLSLNDQRIGTVIVVLREAGARSASSSRRRRHARIASRCARCALPRTRSKPCPIARTATSSTAATSSENASCGPGFTARSRYARRTRSPRWRASPSIRACKRPVSPP